MEKSWLCLFWSFGAARRILRDFFPSVISKFSYPPYLSPARLRFINILQYLGSQRRHFEFRPFSILCFFSRYLAAIKISLSIFSQKSTILIIFLSTRTSYIDFVTNKFLYSYYIRTTANRGWVADIRLHITYCETRKCNFFRYYTCIIFLIIRNCFFYIYFIEGNIETFIPACPTCSPRFKSWFYLFLKNVEKSKYTHTRITSQIFTDQRIEMRAKTCAFLYTGNTSPKICSFDRIWKVNWSSIEIQIQRVKILLRIRSIATFQSLSPSSLDIPPSHQASSRLVNLLRERKRGGKGRREGWLVGWLVEAQLKFSRRNNAETRKRRKKFLPGHFDPRTEEEAVIALKWTWVTQGPPPRGRGIINSQQRAR